MRGISYKGYIVCGVWKLTVPKSSTTQDLCCAIAIPLSFFNLAMANVLPHDKKQLRACLLCSLVKVYKRIHNLDRYPFLVLIFSELSTRCRMLLNSENLVARTVRISCECKEVWSVLQSAQVPTLMGQFKGSLLCPFCTYSFWPFRCPFQCNRNDATRRKLGWQVAAHR